MRPNRTNLALGLILLLLGGWLLAARQVPALREFTENMTGATWTIAAGALVFLFGLLTGTPRMAVPASIIAGIGGFLYYQEQINEFASWSYLCTLIPGFVGVGTILAGLLGENTRHSIAHGLRLIVISAVLFLIFATFFDDLSLLGNYRLPILLILLGLYVLARGFKQGGKKYPDEA